ncbi:hypothetical protein B0H10DRAFT_2185392 [Mycena sp. CBHHK59/15]|nr:hypothetical protein B0H10DRAFT_2185392 [Mycena sp. CBHHK59/15]
MNIITPETFYVTPKSPKKKKKTQKRAPAQPAHVTSTTPSHPLVDAPSTQPKLRKKKRTEWQKVDSILVTITKDFRSLGISWRCCFITVYLEFQIRAAATFLGGESNVMMGTIINLIYNHRQSRAPKDSRQSSLDFSPPDVASPRDIDYIILPSYNSTTSAEILDNLSIIWPVNCFEGILECRIQPSQSWLATETRKYDKSFKLRRSNDDPVTQQSPSSPSPVPCPLSPQGSHRAPGAALELDAQCPSVPSLACSGLASTIHFLNSSQVATSPSIPVAKPPRSIQSPVLLAQSHRSRLPTPPLRPIIKVTVKHRLSRAAASEDVLLLDG